MSHDLPRRAWVVACPFREMHSRVCLGLGENPRNNSDVEGEAARSDHRSGFKIRIRMSAEFPRAIYRSSSSSLWDWRIIVAPRRLPYRAYVP